MSLDKLWPKQSHTKEADPEFKVLRNCGGSGKGTLSEKQLDKSASEIHETLTTDVTLTTDIIDTGFCVNNITRPG